jgi:hypothetical protein
MEHDSKDGEKEHRPMSRISIAHIFHKLTIMDRYLQSRGSDHQFWSGELCANPGRPPYLKTVVWG